MLFIIWVSGVTTVESKGLMLIASLPVATMRVRALGVPAPSCAGWVTATTATARVNRTADQRHPLLALPLIGSSG
jgi:hypothetical protein